MSIAEFEKSPLSKLDYSVDWSPWLSAGDSIDTADWSASNGITISSSPAPSLSANVAVVWLEGGTAGAVYTITCEVTTALGKSDARSFTIRSINL